MAEARHKVSLSGMGWAGTFAMLILAIIVSTYINRVDCALGVQKACAAIAASYEGK